MKHGDKTKKPKPDRKDVPEDSNSSQDYDLENISAFGYTERPMFDRMSSWRYRKFYSLLAVFDKLRLRPNHITGASLLIVAVGFPLLFVLDLPKWAFLVLVIHILLDGLDGPLARYQKYDTHSGAMLDLGNDLTGMVIVLITAAHYELMNPTVAFLYTVGYLYLTFVAIAQNILKISFRFVNKTKYPTYIFLLIHQFTGVDITTWFCLVMWVYMVGHIAVATGNIIKKLDR